MDARKEVNEEVVALSRAARWEQESRKYASENIATHATSVINYVAGKAGLFAGVATDAAQYSAKQAGIGFQYASKQAGIGFQYASKQAGLGFQHATKVAGEVSHYVAELARETCRRPGNKA